MDLKELESKIKETVGPDKSSKELIDGVANQLDQLTHDPVAIGEMAKELRANSDLLGAAILANATTEPKVEARDYAPRKPQSRH